MEFSVTFTISFPPRGYKMCTEGFQMSFVCIKWDPSLTGHLEERPAPLERPIYNVNPS